MKILVGCFLLSLLGLSIASPSPSFVDQYKDLLKTLNGGSTTEQRSDKDATRQYSTLDYIRKNFGGYNAKKQSNDEVTALLESLTTDQHYDESEDVKDMALMQSLFKVIEKLQEERANAMSSESARAHITALLSTLIDAGKKYLTGRYCPKPECPTQYY